MRGFVYSLVVACAMMMSAYVAEAQDTKPRLVVNIVVGAMRADDLERYADGFGEGLLGDLSGNHFGSLLYK